MDKDKIIDSIAKFVDGIVKTAVEGLRKLAESLKDLLCRVDMADKEVHKKSVVRDVVDRGRYNSNSFSISNVLHLTRPNFTHVPIMDIRPKISSIHRNRY